MSTDTKLDELKEFIMENRTILKNVISDTNIYNTEFGMSICKDYKLRFSQKCQGNRCNVFPTSCDIEAGQETIAKFHTHIDQNKLSNQDKAVGIKHGEYINCLGYQIKDQTDQINYHIDCYRHPYGLSEKQQKDIIDIDKKMTDINYKIMRTDQSLKEFERLKDEKFKLFKDRFNAAESNIEPFLKIQL